MLNNNAINELKPFNLERSPNQLSDQAKHRLTVIGSAVDFIAGLENIYSEENIREKTLDINPIIQSIESQAVDMNDLRETVRGVYEAA